MLGTSGVDFHPGSQSPSSSGGPEVEDASRGDMLLAMSPRSRRAQINCYHPDQQEYIEVGVERARQRRQDASNGNPHQRDQFEWTGAESAALELRLEAAEIKAQDEEYDFGKCQLH